MTAPALDTLTDEQLARRVQMCMNKLEGWLKSHKNATFDGLLHPKNKSSFKLTTARNQLLELVQEQLRRAKLFYTCGTQNCPNLGTKYIWNSDGSQDPGFVKGKPCWFCCEHAPLFLQANEYNDGLPLMLTESDWADQQEADLERNALKSMWVHGEELRLPFTDLLRTGRGAYETAKFQYEMERERNKRVEDMASLMQEAHRLASQRGPRD